MPDIHLKQNSLNITDIVLIRELNTFVNIWLSQSLATTDIILRRAIGAISNATQGEASYFGILKRWTGSMWIKAKLLVYTGSWIQKTLKRYNGSEWKEVDTTGI